MEGGQNLPQKVSFGHKIGIKNDNIFTPCVLKHVVEVSGLKTNILIPSGHKDQPGILPLHLPGEFFNLQGYIPAAAVIANDYLHLILGVVKLKALTGTRYGSDLIKGWYLNCHTWIVVISLVFCSTFFTKIDGHRHYNIEKGYEHGYIQKYSKAALKHDMHYIQYMP